MQIPVLQFPGQVRYASTLLEIEAVAEHVLDVLPRPATIGCDGCLPPLGAGGACARSSPHCLPSPSSLNSIDFEWWFEGNCNGPIATSCAGRKAGSCTPPCCTWRGWRPWTERRC